MISAIKRFIKKLRTRRVISAPGWAFEVVVEGNDLCVYDATCTAFGGKHDKMDSGETASGISTALRPEFVGCALPMDFGPCKGSPIPRLPWLTKVHVTEVATGKRLVAALIDLGPARWTGNGLDLTVAAARKFNPRATANNFITQVNFRIPGGAKFLKK